MKQSKTGRSVYFTGRWASIAAAIGQDLSGNSPNYEAAERKLAGWLQAVNGCKRGAGDE